MNRESIALPLRTVVFACLALAAAACRRAGPPVFYGASSPEPEPTPAASTAPEASVPDDIVERVALPYHGFRVRDHSELTPAQLYDDLIRADAVCVGEAHDNPHDHFAELDVVRELVSRAAMRGRQLGVGFEMFQRPYQRALDAYASGRLETAAFLSATHYRERWGWPFAYYRPVLEVGRSKGLELIALNAPREQTHAVATQGLGALSPADRAKIGELDLDDAEHRARFDQMMSGHPKNGAMSHLYEAQVVWDETMAESAAQWLRAATPARLMVILAGEAHCARPAIPRRIERRLAVHAVAVRPLLQSAHVDLAAELDGYDYALVMTKE